MLRTFVLPFVVLALSLPAAEGRLWISEFLTENDRGEKNAFDERPDWIEIHNSGPDAIDLSGYRLTDSAKDLKKWTFPAIEIAAGDFLVVFATGRQPTDSSQIHANFKLAAKGEYLALVDPSGKVLHEYAAKYPKQFGDVTYGLADVPPPSGAAIDPVPGYLSRPTPGKANGRHFVGFVEEVTFSKTHGLFDQPVELALSTPTKGATIRYTLNGSAPSRLFGKRYGGPILISETTVVRAAAFKRGFKPALSRTQSFIFPADVIHQSPTGEPPKGWPEGPINGQRLNYGMNQEIVGKKHSESEVIESLLDIPTVSISGSIDSFFGPTRGFYVNPGQRGPEWEREACLEMFGKGIEDEGVEIVGGIRVRGGFSRSTRNPKHAMRFIFRDRYGKGKLKYPLFGDEGAKIYDHIDFRTSLNNSWAYQGSYNNTLLRDVWSRDAQGEMGQPYTRSRFYHLYLNGHYWGIYMTQERAEAYFAQTYLGGKTDEYDVIKTRGEVIEGTPDSRARFHAAAMEGFADNEAYFRVQGLDPDGKRNPTYERLLDVDNLIDYMLITYYTGDRDGPGGLFASFPNNFYMIYNRKNPDGYKFFEHDSEHSLGVGEDDMVNTDGPFPERVDYFNPHRLHERLTENRHYLDRFTERIDLRFGEGGALSFPRSLARLERREATIKKAVIAHSARWGDANRSPGRTVEDWESAVNQAKEWMKDRTEIVLRQFKDKGWYRALPAPTFTHRGGQVPQGSQVSILAEVGTIYYTTDGSDPMSAEGTPAKSAKVATTASVSTTDLLSEVEHRVHVPESAEDDAHWMRPDFDDSQWTSRRGSIGYDDDSSVSIDHEVPNGTTSCYIRYSFQTGNPAPSQISLDLLYDDGFVAYLNGTRFAAAEAPDTLDWESTATRSLRNDPTSKNWSPFPVESPLLKPGANVLAIHLLNAKKESSDFLLRARLSVVQVTGGTDISIESPRFTLKARAYQPSSSRWSEISSASFESK